MLPIWGAYVASFVALGGVAYQQWYEPVSAKIKLETAKIEREAAADVLKAAVLNHDSKEIDLKVSEMQRENMNRLGIPVRP